jgi:hypothetical protein
MEEPMTEKLKEMIDELSTFDLENCDDPLWAQHRIEELKRRADMEYHPYKMIDVYSLIEDIKKEYKDNARLLRDAGKNNDAHMLHDYTLIIINMIKGAAKDSDKGIPNNTTNATGQYDTILKRLDLTKDAINTVHQRLDIQSSGIQDLNRETVRMKQSHDALAENNAILMRIIESIINDKFTTNDFEAVMIKPCREKPILVKDGKRIDTENITSFDIDWSFDSRINITVTNN